MTLKPKTIPRYLLILLLTLGASLTLGLLSFSGILVIIPTLWVGLAAFALSAGYEGEIYLQNIKHALDKLFQFDYLRREVAKQYLLEHFPDTETELDCPQFFKDYERQLRRVDAFKHKTLTEADKNFKLKEEKNLSDMEKSFALLLFPKPNQTFSEEEQKLQDWLKQHDQEAWKQRLTRRRRLRYGIALFSSLAAFFMTVGTSYLLVEAILLGSPISIVAMATIAGIGYGFLTYNAVTDMLGQNTLAKWFRKIRDDLKPENITVSKVLFFLTAIALAGLAIALTVCTAGTWWTIAKEAKPVFNWMAKMPGFIMGICNPIITGLSSIIFNTQNTSETLEMVYDTKSILKAVLRLAKEKLANWLSENWGQILNPFRIILQLTMIPIRVVLFLGHLVSIGVTADRVPGLSQFTSALLGVISELFEDLHYFLPHHHHTSCDHAKGEPSKPKTRYETTKALLKARLENHHTHSHDMDIPTHLIKTLAFPLYVLATIWDYAASRATPNTALTFTQAWERQSGLKKHNWMSSIIYGFSTLWDFLGSRCKRNTPSLTWQAAYQQQKPLPPKEAPIPIELKEEAPSVEWERQRILYRLQHREEKHKVTTYTKLQTTIRALDLKEGDAKATLQEVMKQNTPQFFNKKETRFWEKTSAIANPPRMA